MEDIVWKWKKAGTIWGEKNKGNEEKDYFINEELDKEFLKCLQIKLSLISTILYTTKIFKKNKKKRSSKEQRPRVV
jgi:hypothetical protein